MIIDKITVYYSPIGCVLRTIESILYTNLYTGSVPFRQLCIRAHMRFLLNIYERRLILNGMLVFGRRTPNP